MSAPPYPRVGDEAFVGPSDDHFGGRAVIQAVKQERSLGELVPFVEFSACPGNWYNWASLLERQERLRKSYGDRVASPDPKHYPALALEWRERDLRAALVTEKARADTAEAETRDGAVETLRAIASQEHAEAELTALRADAQALCDALPRCDGPDDEHPCPRPATRRRRTGAAFEWCDEHAPEGTVDLPRAAPLRALEARLAGRVER